ncbi:MAG: type II toxin-antitoxin system death-on-curing family toxin [Pyrinomonadaceae bacterium]|nr:type II toxin-antitoxin system death-on-curing family toxin [Pyrinomonadaceae bacterium]
MRYLSFDEVVLLHSLLIAQSGGALGLRDRGALESAVAQPEASFGGEALYPTLAAKAAALGHSLIQNHPFVDGNKRIGHGAMEVFLLLNGQEIEASVEEQEETIIGVASGKISRSEFSEWLSQHLVEGRRPT